jgi:hypothetical protein
MAKLICWFKGHILNVVNEYPPFCSRCVKTLDELGIGKNPSKVAKNEVIDLKVHS